MVISWWFSWDKLGKPTSVWGYSARCCPSFASWLGWQRYISPFFLGFITPRVKMSMPSGNHLPEKTCKGCVFGYFLYLCSSFKWYLWGANMIFPEKWSTPKSMVYKLIFPTIIVILRINPPFSGATSDSHWCVCISTTKDLKIPSEIIIFLVEIIREIQRKSPWNHHFSRQNHPKLAPLLAPSLAPHLIIFGQCIPSSFHRGFAGALQQLPIDVHQWQSKFATCETVKTGWIWLISSGFTRLKFWWFSTNHFMMISWDWDYQRVQWISMNHKSQWQVFFLEISFIGYYILTFDPQLTFI